MYIVQFLHTDNKTYTKYNQSPVSKIKYRQRRSKPAFLYNTYILRSWQKTKESCWLKYSLVCSSCVGGIVWVVKRNSQKYGFLIINRIEREHTQQKASNALLLNNFSFYILAKHSSILKYSPKLRTTSKNVTCFTRKL